MSEQIKSVGKWVSIIERYGQMYLERKYQKYGIGHGQVKFLLLLYQKDGVSQDTLAHQLRMDKATTARAIQKLECVGFVRRQPREEDRRVNLVYLTGEAIKIKQEVKAILKTWTDVITKGFSQEEKELLLEMLKRVADNAVDYFNELERR
ncbi:MarR family transcriptional regulator [Desulfoscipio geothermicus]|uniref:DNA-binding transcriptional regulator, MarR family n=1 Tax=Desulfoscipio geothermicus DSM 3669 TaxID=1121426 RepID=A0A1I6CRE6_9FIRM|nr:MarR family transcriptional regulator [Desulfoscipio geothermicus]SFQ95657.1 DNA-binding transcriptional regulator, MarR family [Desulfoscipio geothermicus DSM 3669]